MSPARRLLVAIGGLATLSVLGTLGYVLARTRDPILPQHCERVRRAAGGAYA